jgi:hypothetical protein
VARNLGQQRAVDRLATNTDEERSLGSDQKSRAAVRIWRRYDQSPSPAGCPRHAGLPEGTGPPDGSRDARNQGGGCGPQAPDLRGYSAGVLQRQGRHDTSLKSPSGSRTDCYPLVIPVSRGPGSRENAKAVVRGGATVSGKPHSPARWAALAATGVLALSGLAASACGLGGTGAPQATPSTSGESLSATSSVTPSPTPTVPPTPEVTPVPEKTLEQIVADYLDGTTPTPRLFTAFHGDKTFAPLNLIVPDSNNINKPEVNSAFQFVNLGQIVEYDALHTPWLVELMGLRDGTKEDPQNPAKGRIVVKGQYGRLNSNDIGTLITNSGKLWSPLSANTVRKEITVSELQQALKSYEGSAMISEFYVITGPEVQGPDLPTDKASKAAARAQNPITTELLKALITSEIESIPLSKVPMSDALEAIIITKAPAANQFTNDVFDPSQIPMIALARPYDMPD